MELDKLPPEIRQAIVAFLVENYEHQASSRANPTRGCYSLAPFATVCKEWQRVVERYTFAELNLSLGRLDEFKRYVVGVRRFRLRNIRLHVKLPTYECNPCTQRESWEDKIANNAIFTLTFKRLFCTMSQWPTRVVNPGGIKLEMCASSPSDLRNAPFDIWQKRRWNASDIGEKRFSDSVLDFVGNSELERVVGIFDPVYAITEFKTSIIDRRAIMPAAYGEIVSALPCVREVELDIMKEKRLAVRKLAFTQFGDLMVRWPYALESLTLRGNTLSSWKTLPHENIAEADTADRLCASLREGIMTQLKDFKLLNLLRIREFFSPVWPTRDDQEAFQKKLPKLPTWKYLENIHLLYGSLTYKVEWFKETGDLNKHEITREYRNKIALSSARMAMFMPNLKTFRVTQRPLLWAGKHEFTYTAEKHAYAELKFVSTFQFVFEQRVIEAWEEVAAKHARVPLTVTVEKIGEWPETAGNGNAPTIPSLSF